MTMDEREREKLISKLKTVKTSDERDRILWLLAGQDKAARGKPQRPEATGAGKPAAAKPEDRMEVRLPMGKLGGIGSITALLFLFYGIIAIATAVMKLLQGEAEGDEIRQLIMGGLFVFFGVAIFIKARRAQQKTAGEA